MIGSPERLERGVYRRMNEGRLEYGSRCDELSGQTTWRWGFPTRSKARQDYQARRSGVREARAAGGTTLPTKGTVGALTTVYLQTIKGKRLTYRQKKGHLDWWAEYFKQQPILTLRSTQIEAGMARLAHEGRAPATANRYAESLRRLTRKLVKPASWVVDLWRDVEFYPEPEDPLPALKDEEEDQLLKALGYPDALYVRLAVLLGLRRTEFFRLRWEWVWWKAAILKVPAFKRHPPIDLPLPDEAVAILKVLWQELGRPKEGWVFPVRQQTFIGIVGKRAFKRDIVRIDQTTPINADNWYRSHYKAVIREAGLPDWITFHTLRRTWASRAGSHTPARILQLLGRWKNMKTAERYCHPLEGPMREAMAKGAEGEPKVSKKCLDRARSHPGKLHKLLKHKLKGLA